VLLISIRMLSDRQYMRDADGGSRFDLVKWLMVIFAGLFVLQLVAERWLDQRSYYGWFWLFSDSVLHGQRLWTLLTYSFLQPVGGYDGGFFVLLTNLLGLYFFGGGVRDLVGPRRLAWLFAGFIAVGAAAWCAAYVLRVDWPLYGPLVTLSGIFALYCCYHADEPFPLFAFFIVPVTMKPKYFAWLWVALNATGFLFYEMVGRRSPLWNGHAAILAVMLAAYGYYRVAGRVDPFGQSSSATIILPRWLRRRRSRPAPRFQVNLTNRDDLRAEVDRILDKINSQGFGALSDDEKRILDEARDLLSRR